MLGAVLFLFAPCAQAPDGASPPAAQTVPAADESARFTRWNESLDLDLPGEVLQEGLALVDSNGALAKDARAVAIVARALTRAARVPEARELLARRADALPVEWITAERARLLLDDDDLEGTLALLYDESAKTLKSPAIPEAWWLAGRAHARAGQWDQAVTLLEKYLQLEPRSAQAAGAWHLLAQAALRRNDAARAKFCAEREAAVGRWHSFFNARRLQIRENPREPLPRLSLAQLWLEAEDFPRARAVLVELVAVAPDFARGWMALGEVQRKQDELSAASESYGRALTLDATLGIARYNRALIARMQSRDDDARRDFEVLVGGAAAREPRFLNAHLELARLLTKAGESERATAAYARYQELGGKEKL